MKLIVFAFYILLCLSADVATAQKKIKESSPPEKKIQSIAEKISGMKHLPGLFDTYYDEKQDKLFLIIDKFDSIFLYVHSLSSGIGSNDIGLDRGQLGKESIVKFERRGPKVLLTEPNWRYRAITSNAAEKKAVEEAFAQSVLWGFKVEAEEDNKVLVDASDFFLQDVHDVIGTLRNTKQGAYSLDKSRSAFYLPRTKNFPDNSEFEVTLTFTGQPIGNFIGTVAPTPSSITVRQHHSFVKLPDDKYKLRKFDPRAGYINISYYDYSTPISEPIEKRYITRHRLEKKDPSAKMSEPVKPIIYYLDRGTPEPIRSALLAGASWWNQAFEAAGYKNAFRMEMMPEGADPMDIRYNHIQWVHRSTRGWSYGASVVDPRTGEIIKGLVTLGSLRVRQDFLIAEGLLAPYKDSIPVSKEMELMALARLRLLSAHEVGHTLGLSHSYASSTEDFASVMDYPHPMVNVKDGKIDLSKAYDDKIGSWDKVAIAYGYQDFPVGVNEEQELNSIIQNSLKSGLSFLSDQDARPQGSAHPFAHLWDNGKDAADELERVLEIRKIALNNFGKDNIKTGAPMATLEEVLVPMYFFHRYQAEATSKLIGGLNYRYALKGDQQLVTEFVSPSIQSKALKALLKTLSPETLVLSEDILKIIPPRPLGYFRHRELIKVRTELTFDGLAAAESAADLTVGLLLNPARASRLVEYHAREKTQLSLEQISDQLINVTIKAEQRLGYSGAVQMIVNDVVLNNLFNLALQNDATPQVRAIIQLKLSELKLWLTKRSGILTDETWKAHHFYSLNRIKRFKDHPEEYGKDAAFTLPPGAPIGSFDMNYCDTY